MINQPVKPHRSSPMKEASASFSKVDSTIFVAIATVLGYLVAYGFQLGQFNYYGINTVLMGQIYLTDIIISATAVLVCVAIALFVQAGLERLYKRVSRFWSAIFRIILPIAIVFLLTAFLFRMMLFVYLLVFFILLYFFLALVSSKKDSYRERIIDFFSAEGLRIKNYLPENVRKYWVQKKMGTVMFLIFILPYLAYMVGMYTAFSATNYLTFEEGGSEYVVLTSTSDILIAAPLNDEHQLGSDVVIISLNGVGHESYTFVPQKFEGGLLTE
ncbi:hypothetical protein ACE1TF_13860 [Geomicrobium sp. JSM 1781026]|uniref:hypothetical protein n=1 Tax=Geomicrobium sp. JSM 1781026 TaxID=3344580 RepID=UPI0035C0A63C